MSGYCRFEILPRLPYNDGRPIPREILADIAIEVQRRFGGVSWESQVVEGIWHREGVEYRDNLSCIFAETQDTPENRRFFTEPKARVKARLEQLDVWLTVHPIEVL